MRGRKPKPTKLKALAGNPGERPLPANEPQPEPYDGPPPPELEPDALEFWLRMAPKLQAAGVLTEFDVDKFRGAAVVYGWWLKACREVNKTGSVVKTRDGNVIQNPWLAVANRHYDQWNKAMGDFGMSPADRARVSVEKPAVADALDELAARRVAGRAKAKAKSLAQAKRKAKAKPTEGQG